VLPRSDKVHVLGERLRRRRVMTDSAQLAKETEPLPSDLSTAELEEELTLSAYDVHHVRGRRYEALLVERKGRTQKGRVVTRPPDSQPALPAPRSRR
jgi:hypothetical protein